VNGYSNHCATDSNAIILPLDETEWRAICRKAQAEAGRACGASERVYALVFSAEIRRQHCKLPYAPRMEAAEIAIREFEYMDVDAPISGECCHGLDLLTCPGGCFED